MNKPEQEFLDHLLVVRNYSPRTVKSYQEDIDKFCEFIYHEGVMIDGVDVICIRNFLTEELNQGISKRSCKRRLSSLKHFYKYMVNVGYIKDNPFVFVSAPKVETKYPHALYKDQIAELFKRNAERTDELALRDQAILYLLYYSGIRADELVKLDVQSIAIKDRVVRVLGKGNKERIIPFTADCQKVLKAYIDRERIVLLRKSKDMTPALFLNAQGERLTTRGLEYILDSIEDYIPRFKKVIPHDYKRMMNSIAAHMADGMSEDEAKLQAFHENTAVTL